MLGRHPEQLCALFRVDEGLKSRVPDASNRSLDKAIDQAFEFNVRMDCGQSDLFFERHSVDPFGFTERDALPRLAAVDYFMN